MAAQFTSKVIAYYTPPKDAEGKQPPVQKYEMWWVDWEEAKKSNEGDRWSQKPPSGSAPVEDKTESTVDFKNQAKPNPPPVVERGA